MNKLKIYQKIHDIAHQGQQDGSIYTRADLAYDLQELGISQDTVEVGWLVWEAYQHFKNDNAIKSFFYDNDKKVSLVDEYQVDHLISQNNDALFPLLRDKLKDGNRSIERLNQAITQTMNGSIGKTGSNVLNTVMGTQGVVNVRNEATFVFNNYSQLIGNYDDVKSSIKYLIADFTKLRSYVCNIYQQYAMVLTDAFGDSIKAVAPELFDFDSVEWLDVQSMLQTIKLDYDKITERCSMLMSDISGSFTDSIKQASSSYRVAGNKQTGLLLAALNMVSHYVNAGQKTNELKQELLSLKNSVKHDVTLIKGDLIRLLVIYKSLNDLYIPQSETFCRFSKQVLTTEWQRLEDALYGNTAIKQMKQRRDEILAESKEVEKEMTDAEMNISYYTSHINECQQLLDSLRPQYEQAKQSKPQKPFFLINLFTFGASGKKYNRAIYDWNMACKPVISRFEDLQVDVKLDQDELLMHQTSFTQNKKRSEELKRELKQQSKLIMDNIKVDTSTRVKMLPHLEAMVQMLRLAREIANSKLDSKLTKTVSIDRKDTELPAELRQRINAFADSVRTLAENNYYLNSQQAPSVPEETGYTPELQEAENTAIQNTINLFESWGHLQAMKAQSAIAHKKYDEELERLQDEFRKNLSDIDNKSSILRKSLQKINTAQNHEQLKEGLLSLLGENNKAFTEKDWDDFLNGDKTIEL